MKHWIDNADSYICPVCGLEVPSPVKYEGCKCPRCGFQDEKDVERMNKEKCSYNWEAECDSLKQKLEYTSCRLKEAEQLLNEARKEVETLKATCKAQNDVLIDYKGQIEAFKFVIQNGR